MSVSEVLALLVVALAAPLNWYVTLRLWQLSRRSPKVLVLRERALAAFALALIVTVFALVFVNNEAIPPWFDAEQTRVITRTTLLLLSILPSVYWLRIYSDD